MLIFFAISDLVASSETPCQFTNTPFVPVINWMASTTVSLGKPTETERHVSLITVNRNNDAKRFYERRGFEIIKEADFDIGNGYFMNDYVLEKKL